MNSAQVLSAGSAAAGCGLRFHALPVPLLKKVKARCAAFAFLRSGGGGARQLWQAAPGSAAGRRGALRAAASLR
jgi:hypothetical protein